jgi:type IV secretory pathway VirB10-like protein
VSRENLARREFLRNVAGTVVALAAATALGSCSGPNSEPPVQGGAPFLGPSEKAVDASVPQELPKPPQPPQPPSPPPAPPAGIRPDIPEPPQPQPTAGVRPDNPPSIQIDVPEPRPTRGIRPD